MAHFALLDENNNVTQIDVVNNEVINNLPFPESEPIGVAFLKNIYGDATNWLQTSYNSNFRGIYAVIGGFYDTELDVFVAVKLFPSWVRTQNGTGWEPPIPYPDDKKEYVWDEATVAWVEIVHNQDEPTQV
jgi:hypothetical protein